jgi:hypothetical protein
MTLYINGSKTVGNGGLAGEYLATGNNSGVFIDVAPVTFGAALDAHVGVAFFCDGVPPGAPDHQAWTGEARGVTFYPGGQIRVEDWHGINHVPPQQNYVSAATWQPGITYRVTATYTTGNVTLAVYKTDSAGNVVSLLLSTTRTSPASKGTHACVFATDGGEVGCTPVALYP